MIVVLPSVKSKKIEDNPRMMTGTGIAKLGDLDHPF